MSQIRVMNKAIVLLSVFLINLSSVWGATVSVRVSGDNDDAEELISDGDMYRGSTDLEFSYDSYHGGLQIVGMRFRNVAIPQGEVIDSAYISFETDETDSGTTNLVIYGEDTDDANLFANNSGNISSRTKTTASVNWSPSAWNTVNELHQTVDISTIIKEIVDRPGWSSGNDLVIMIEPGTGCTGSSCQRTAESHDGVSSEAPMLVVNYGVGGGSCDTFHDQFSTESYSRQDGTVNWATNWDEVGDNDNAVSGDIEIEGGQLQLEGEGSASTPLGAPYIQREADLSSYTTATLSFDYSESGDWEGNDDIEIYASVDGGSNWTLIHTFTNDQGSSTQQFSQSITGYISANTRIAFVEKANSSGERFFIDNVQIDACTPSGGPASAWFQFDESQWTGSSGEVIDSNSNSFHATATNGPTTAALTPAVAGDPGTCSYGTFDGVDDYVALPSGYPNLSTDYTITAWIRTTDNTRSGQRILIDDQSNTQGFGFSLGDGGTGRVRFYSRSTNPVSLDTPNVVASNTWYFVAAVADITNLTKRIYVYDQAGTQLAATSGGYTGSWGSDAGAVSIGGENDASSESGPNFHFVGNLDEVRVHGAALSAAQISALMNDTRTCSSLQCINDDFNRASLGSDWVVSNTSGSFGDPRIVNGRLRLTDASNNVATVASLQRLFPGANNRIVYDFDLFAYNGNGADGIAVTLSDSAVSPVPGGYGGSLGYAQRCGINGFAGGWLGVGFDEYGNFSNPNECRSGGPGFRVDAVAIHGSGSALTGYPYLAGTGTLSPGIDQSGASPAPGHRYRVTVDHTSGSVANVSVERDTNGSGYQTLIGVFDVFSVNPSQAAVPQNWLMSLTGSTGGSRNIHEIDNFQVCATSILPIDSIDHYRFYHDGSGLTCSPENIQIRACLDSTCSAEYSGTINATLGPAGWVGGTSQSFASGDTLQLWYVTAGTATLQISGDSSDVTAVNVPRCFIGATEQADCNLLFLESGFAFDVQDHVADLQQTVTIAAVRKDLVTDQCVPGFQNVSRDIQFWSSYLNPLSGTLPVRIGGVAIAGSSPGSTRTLSFDNVGEATFTLQYADVGQMSLNASYLGTGDDAGLVMTGIDNFITRPDHFVLTIPGNPAAADATGAVFKKAGELFQVEVEARNASDAVTPNYGQESSAESVLLVNTLIVPAGQANPALAGSFNAFGTDCDGDPAAGVACGDFSWNEVGIITLQPGIFDGNYLGTGDVAGNSSGNVGRFIPNRLSVSANSPQLGHGCGVGGYTYLGQEFPFLVDPVLTVTALNSGGGTTSNYGGSFWKLSSALGGRNYTDAAGTGLAVSLTSGAVALSEETDYDGDGVLTISGDRLTYAKPVTARAPFASSVNLNIPAGNLTDADGVCYDFDANGSCDSFQIAAIGNTPQRFGRLTLANAYGPEILPLTLTLAAEYYDGSAYVINVDDSCTTYDFTDLGLTNYQGNLAGGETTAAGNGSLVAGVGTMMSLSAPGDGNDGSVDLTLDLSILTGAAQEWLRDAGTDPTAKATFGIYQGNQRLIYMRESVQ